MNGARETLPERAYISIGSNIEPERHVISGFQRLAELGRVLAVSKVYENPAIGESRQPDFLNAAALVKTSYRRGAGRGPGEDLSVAFRRRSGSRADRKAGGCSIRRIGRGHD